MTPSKWKSSEDARELLKHAAKVLPRKLLVLGTVRVAEEAQRYANDETREAARRSLDTTLAWVQGEVGIDEVRRTAAAAFDAAYYAARADDNAAYAAATAAHTTYAADYATDYAASVAEYAASVAEYAASAAYANAAANAAYADYYAELSRLAGIVREVLPYSSEGNFRVAAVEGFPDVNEIYWSEKDEWVFFPKSMLVTSLTREGMSKLTHEESVAWDWVMTNRPEGDL